MSRSVDRRNFLTRAAALAGTLGLSGCDGPSDQAWVRRVLDSAEGLTRFTQRALISPAALAREYDEAEISPVFKANGSTNPDDGTYKVHAANGFAHWKLAVSGLVETPLELSLVELKALPSRTQITRHDCVEGWSCIGKWTGVPLKVLLDRADSKRAPAMSCSIAPTISDRPAPRMANITSRSGSRMLSTRRPFLPTR